MTKIEQRFTNAVAAYSGMFPLARLIVLMHAALVEARDDTSDDAVQLMLEIMDMRRNKHVDEERVMWLYRQCMQRAQNPLPIMTTRPELPADLTRPLEVGDWLDAVELAASQGNIEAIKQLVRPALQPVTVARRRRP